MWCVKEDAGIREAGSALFGGRAVLACHLSTQKNIWSSVPSWLDALGEKWLVAVKCVLGGKRWFAFNLCRTLEERRSD